MKQIVAIFTVWLFMPLVFAQQQNVANMQTQALAYVEGKQYKLIQSTPEALAMEDPTAKALLAAVPKNKVAVWQFFNYGCSGCNRMEPIVAKWHQDKKEQNLIAFTDIPVAWSKPEWTEYARAFYIEQALSQSKNKAYKDVLQVGHEKIFAALHVEGKDLSTRENMRDFFHAELGVLPTDFDAHYNSFDVRRRMKQAELMAKAYSIRSLPTFVVAGKYYVDVAMAGGMEQVINVVNYLVNKETFTAEEGKIDFGAVPAK